MIDRIYEPLRQLVLQITGEKLYGLYPYNVKSHDEQAQTITCEPIRASAGLPNLTRVPMRAPLLNLTVQPGTEVIIGFEGGDPAYPFVALYDYAKQYAAALAVMRQGDPVGIPVALTPALSPAGVPIPNVYCLVLTPEQVLNLRPTNPPTVPPRFTTTLFGNCRKGSVSTRCM